MGKKKDIIVLDYDYLKDIISMIPYPRDKALFAAMYGTAARVSEIADLKKENIMEVERKGKKLLVLTIPNRKHRIAHLKAIPIPFSEEWIVTPILKWKGQCQEKAFNLSERQIYNLTKKYFKVNPHTFRHSRATHLIQKYDINLERLKNIMGWKDLKPSSVYVHLAWGDVADAFG